MHFMMMCHVIARRHEFEIFNSIVQPIAIDVMDAFRRIKFSSKMLLHYPSMLLRLFAINSHHLVATFCNGAASICSKSFTPSYSVWTSSTFESSVVSNAQTPCSMGVSTARNGAKSHLGF
jgi:hypothetical protein